uniref:F-box domain-containing protein n=1 Tax=Triticum urartu TaxID=4572 RepID=A0A8R7UIP0_TRIUA
MDDDAAASASKKRKRDEPEAPDPPTTRDGIGGGDEGLDLISRLPDELLGTIISLLPGTKEAARTAILSSRWRHLWRTTPLSLVVDCGLSGQERNRIAIVSKILAAHPGPAHRLFLSDIRLSRDRYGKFNGWFRSPSLDGLEELDFTSSGDTFCWDRRTRPPRPLPPSVLRFAPTLRAASIGCCDFPEINAAPALVLPRLKQLSLYEVAISEAAIHR